MASKILVTGNAHRIFFKKGATTIIAKPDPDKDYQ